MIYLLKKGNFAKKKQDGKTRIGTNATRAKLSVYIDNTSLCKFKQGCFLIYNTLYSNSEIWNMGFMKRIQLKGQLKTDGIT